MRAQPQDPVRLVASGEVASSAALWRAPAASFATTEMERMPPAGPVGPVRANACAADDDRGARRKWEKAGKATAKGARHTGPRE